MSIYRYVRNLWKNPKNRLGSVWKERILKWRKEPVSLRVKRPTRIDKARSLGYKAKQGYILVRQRVSRGGRTRPDIKSGRRSRRSGQRKDVSKSYQWVAEERAQKGYKNCTVLNSYFVGQDGNNYWYEVILIDRAHPSIMADKRINWISSKRGRAARGLTSAADRSRGLRNKGKGAEKIRPGRRANLRRSH